MTTQEELGQRIDWAASAGGLVCRGCWECHEYIYRDRNGEFRDNKGHVWTASAKDAAASDWVRYVQPGIDDGPLRAAIRDLLRVIDAVSSYIPKQVGKQHGMAEAMTRAASVVASVPVDGRG